MSYKEFIEKLYQLINSPVLLNNYKEKNLNWTHPIRVAVANFEFEKYLKSNSTAPAQPAAKPLEKIVVPATVKQKALQVFKRSHRLYKLIDRVLFLIKRTYPLIQAIYVIFCFRLRAAYLVVTGKSKKINFSIDNYEVQYGGSYFNPYSDNINLTEQTFNLCFPIWNKNDNVKRAYYRPLVIKDLRDAYFLLFKANALNTDFLLPAIDFLEDKSAGEFVKHSVIETYNNYLFFTFLFKRLKPGKVYLYDSYNVYSLGLIAAAKQLGIETIEQQHGIISPGHFGYCYNFNNANAADFICDQLDYYTKPLIDWTKQSWTFYPKLVDIKVSPAVQLWAKFKDKKHSAEVERLKEQIGKRRVITFGLTDLLIPAWLSDCLVESADNYFFCFRLHPRYSSYNQHQVEEIKKRINNCDFVISSSIPLFDLLEISDYFLSDGSTTLIESLSFNLTAICFSEYFSNEMFKPYIKENLILPVKSGSEFMSVLASKN